MSNDNDTPATSSFAAEVAAQIIAAGTAPCAIVICVNPETDGLELGACRVDDPRLRFWEQLTQAVDQALQGIVARAKERAAEQGRTLTTPPAGLVGPDGKPL